MTAETSDRTISSSPRLNTYHCLCSTHLLTTTYSLPTLPHRAPPTLDKAYILPYPRPPRKIHLSYPQPAHEPPPQSDGLAPNTGEGADEDDAEKEGKGLTALHNSPSPSTQEGAEDIVIIEREDGFEKRWFWRCGRCGLVVGYWLGWPGEAECTEASADGQAGDGKIGVMREGRRPDVLFVLPGALVSTGEMGVI